MPSGAIQTERPSLSMTSTNGSIASRAERLLSRSIKTVPPIFISVPSIGTSPISFLPTPAKLRRNRVGKIITSA